MEPNTVFCSRWQIKKYFFPQKKNHLTLIFTNDIFIEISFFRMETFQKSNCRPENREKFKRSPAGKK